MYYSTDSLEASCSDCQLELMKKRWTLLLLRWLKKCVNPKMQSQLLTEEWLVEIINKYKADVCDNDIDRAILCNDDLEPFLRYKYPILRLRYFTEEKDNPKKIYIMTSVLLFHCCISSNTGAVEEDICKRMSRYDKEMILKFCESLGEMEVTVNNVESAIRMTCEAIPETFHSKKKKSHKTAKRPRSAPKRSYATASEEYSQGNASDGPLKQKGPKKSSTLTFKSSITVSGATDSSSLSKTSLVPDSETSDTMSLRIGDDGNTTVESNEIAIFNCQGNNDDDCYGGIAIVTCSDDPEMVEIGDSIECPRLGDSDPCECSTCEKTGDSTCRPDCAQCRSSSKSSFFKCKKKKKEKKETCKKERKLFRWCCSRGDEKQRRRCWLILLGILLLLLLLALLAGLLAYFLLHKKGDRHAYSDQSHGDYGGHGINIGGGSKGSGDLIGSHGIFDTGGNINSGGIIDTGGLIDGGGNTNDSHHNFEGSFLTTQVPTHQHHTWSWKCNNSLCIKVFEKEGGDVYRALSRCMLTCMGPQIWPYPIGSFSYSNEVVSVSTNKLEFKDQSIPSEIVNQYLGEAFKLFIADLARLETMDHGIYNRRSISVEVKKMAIKIEVESDPDPRMRLNTDESYHLDLSTVEDKIIIHIKSPSFCGVRHGLETLSQLILLDQHSGNLITLSQISIKDAPTYKYRGLMLDTARNYVPMTDILRTIDGMASCKLNTFHWRISDSASFPLLLATIPNLFEYGGYDRTLVYTEEDVKTVVSWAGVRGIRVLIEVGVPGPVGRAWSWSEDATCPMKNDQKTCDNELCTRLKITEPIFEVLQHIYKNIIALTGVDDIFHLSNGVFSLSNCYNLIEDREGFLEKALENLKLANKGFMPKLPIIWYTAHLAKPSEAKTWEKYGVQVDEFPSIPGNSFSKYKLIHSSRWDLSCDIKKQKCMKYRTWQDMYTWRSWRTIEAFSIEGGEAMLWSDMVDSGNIDFHIWPRAAAVAERLWSDMVLNATASAHVYIRLDSHRWRMLLRGFRTEPVWPVWCSFNPNYCIEKLHRIGKNKK